jgi:hypothetical protein
VILLAWVEGLVYNLLFSTPPHHRRRTWLLHVALDTKRTSAHATMLVSILMMAVVVLVLVFFVSRTGSSRLFPRLTSHGQVPYQQSRPLLPVTVPNREASLQQVALPQDLAEPVVSRCSRDSSQSQQCSARSVPGTPGVGTVALKSFSAALHSTSKPYPQKVPGSGGSEGYVSHRLEGVECGVQCVTADCLLPHPPLPRIRTR